MNVVNISLQVLPVVEEEMIYPVVDKVIDYIKSTGVKYFVSPMETTMEGDIDILLDIVKKAQDICVREGAKRVISIVKIDCRPDGVTIDEKMNKYISQ